MTAAMQQGESGGKLRDGVLYPVLRFWLTYGIYAFIALLLSAGVFGTSCGVTWPPLTP